jgi:magnesium transporter
MIEIFRHLENKLEILEKPVSKSWVNVIQPNYDEIEKIKKMFSIPEELILSLKDVNEMPAIDEHPKFTFITIRVPFSEKDHETRHTTVPVGIFIMEDIVMTISFFQNDVIKKIKDKKFNFTKTQFVFRFLLISAKLYLEYLRDIEKRMYEIESKLEKTESNKFIMELLDLEKDLVYFATSLDSNAIVIDRLSKEQTKQNHLPLKSDEDKKLIEKAIDENNQAIQTANIYSNILSNTLDAFASIVSNNLNNVIKILTSITIIVAVPTLIASIYGMNVRLPFQDHSQAFIIVMIATFLITLIPIMFFWKRKLL